MGPQLVSAARRAVALAAAAADVIIISSSSTRWRPDLQLALHSLHRLTHMCAHAAHAPASLPAEHFADELELELADTLLEEFHLEAEDGSPAQV